MDNIDLKIIAILQENGRVSNLGIGSSIGISEGTVRRRLKHLLDNKIINIAAIPDLERMGYNASALVGIQTDPDKIESVADRLCELSEIQYVTLTTGSFDIFVWIALPTAKELGVFLREKLGLTPGIRRTETFVSLSTKKPTFSNKNGLESSKLSS
ncbi:MAG: Lrp/AsnC family transcriptional regulator, regulator for asnA, asnC and gidA [Chloroflexi bacterium]|jgi:Lrp/AsnC family transcriptional regulator for asnA, asnC and gidA|nr:MAG: Lrp/AsnC family transcriptional regulator, regulator for asnA, asnC and gidA [Chloroflexota bacterium]